MRTPSILACAVLISAACATQLYPEPATGTLARVRFSTNIDAVTVVRTYADPSCTSDEQEWMRLKRGFLLNPSPKRLGMPLWDHHDNGAKEVRISAAPARTYLVMATGRSGLQDITCGVTFRPTFAQDKDYEVAYIWTPTECHVDVHELVQSADGQHVRRQLAMFNNRVTPANAACIAQFKKMRLY